MKYIILILTLLTFNANALDLHIGGGYAISEEPHNGLYFQEEFKHSLDLDGPTVNIGVTLDFTDKYNILVGVRHMGTYKTTAPASSSDENYYAFQRGEEDIWPLTTWNGKGQAYGIYFLAEREYDWGFLRVGIWAHKSEWSVDIQNWHHGVDEHGKSIGGVPGAFPSKTSRDFTVKGDTGVQVGPVFEIGKHFGKYSIVYGAWHVVSRGQFPAIYRGWSQVLRIERKFEL